MELKHALQLEGKLEGGALEEVLKAGTEILQRREELEGRRSEVFNTSDVLYRILESELQSIIRRLNGTLGGSRYAFTLFPVSGVEEDSPIQQALFRNARIQSGRTIEYIKSIVLTIGGPESNFWLQVSLMQADAPFTGSVRSDSLFIYNSPRFPNEYGTDWSAKNAKLDDAPFIFSYRDSASRVESQFREWLSSVLTRGLAIWFAQERRIIDALAEQETPPES